MLAGVDEIYLKIAQKIVEKIDDKWIKAKLSAEVYGDASQFRGSYHSTLGDDKPKYFKIHHELFDLFEELHEITTEDSDNKWNRATYTLEPTGKFNIDFEWDQALADEIKRLSNE